MPRAVLVKQRPPESQGTGDWAEVEQLANVAKALGHPARMHIVRLLFEKQTCIGCDIVDEVGLAQSTVSEHLRILKAAGIITGEIDRPRVCYSLNPSALEPLRQFLNGVGAGRSSLDLRKS
jgi:ArsR family transcriptional regulator, arsenate/arsenite/antimonite-responsive transcriptional repressor